MPVYIYKKDLIGFAVLVVDFISVFLVRISYINSYCRQIINIDNFYFKSLATVRITTVHVSIYSISSGIFFLHLPVSQTSGCSSIVL